MFLIFPINLGKNSRVAVHYLPCCDLNMSEWIYSLVVVVVVVVVWINDGDVMEN